VNVFDAFALMPRLPRLGPSLQPGLEAGVEHGRICLTVKVEFR